MKPIKCYQDLLCVIRIVHGTLEARAEVVRDMP